jgi:hypothetical protein
MGVELVVTFRDRQPPAWPAVAELLAKHGWPVQMRMIDGELAFPDEQPPDAWREIRVAAGAMVTIRRGEGEVRLVAWGNADEAQRRLWQALAWAFASAGEGLVRTEQGEESAAAFGQRTGLFPEAGGPG